MVVVLTAACSAPAGSENEPRDDGTGPASSERSADTVGDGTALSEPASSRSPTSGPQDETVAAAGSEAAEARAFEIVEALTSDELGGRDNLSSGSASARDLLVEELSTFAEPAFTERSGADGYLQPFELGTNIVALVPGTDLADEYILLGAHYDSVGPAKCSGVGSRSDTICNGATDNAAGVAAVIEIARQVASGGPRRRSLVITLWDGEEDGLAGSRHYIDVPAVPLADSIVYVNYDIQGAVLTPAVADWTVVQGSDTGGPPLIGAIDSAIAGSDLRYLSFGIAMSQTRSDHASLLRVGVPVVSFGDGTNGCYHTVDDELAVVDFDKLTEQIAVGERLVARLVDTNTPPDPPDGQPTPSFEDVSQFLDLVVALEPDVDRLPTGAGALLMTVRSALAAVVEAGAEAFDPTSIPEILRRAFVLEAYLTDAPCLPI